MRIINFSSTMYWKVLFISTHIHCFLFSRSDIHVRYRSAGKLTAPVWPSGHFPQSMQKEDLTPGLLPALAPWRPLLIYPLPMWTPGLPDHPPHRSTPTAHAQPCACMSAPEWGLDATQAASAWPSLTQVHSELLCLTAGSNYIFSSVGSGGAFKGFPSQDDLPQP